MIIHRGEACLANTCEESSELLKRKPYKQYHTHNQGLWSQPVFLLLSKRTLLLKFHQYSVKNTRRDTLKTRKPHFIPNWKQQKNIFPNREPFKNFLMKVSGKSHNAEDPKESFMLTKHFVSSKN